jgi:pimeloyl-ACP methyl ester carboxylesterase
MPDDAVLYSADLPGYGRSSEPREWQLAAIAEEVLEAVHAIRAQTGTNTVTLIGNCSGAIIGMLAAQRMSWAFERLVLIDPFAYVPWYFTLFVAARFGKYAYYSTFANPVGRWLTNLSLKSRRGEKTDLTASFTRVNHQTTYRYLQLLASIGGFTQFGDLQMPIDILHGERTFKAVKESAMMYKSIWPQARYVTLAGAGHLPIEEATAQVCAILFQKPEVAPQPMIPA